MRLFLCVFVLGIVFPTNAAEPPKNAYRVLAQDKGHVAIIGTDGKLEWEVECKYNSHDIHLLPNGNLLLHTAAATVTEMTPKKEVVWSYTAKCWASWGLDGSARKSHGGHRRSACV